MNRAGFENLVLRGLGVDVSETAWKFVHPGGAAPARMPGYGPQNEKPGHGRVLHASGSLTRRWSGTRLPCARIVPMRETVSPAAVSGAIAASAFSGATMTVMPIPQLNAVRLGIRHAAVLLQPLERRRHRPGLAVPLRRQVLLQHAGMFSTRLPPVMAPGPSVPSLPSAPAAA